MADEITTQTNVLTVDAESVPVTEPIVQTPEEPVVDSSAVTSEDFTEHPEDGSEPSKVVKELITQRHKRQEAERELAYLKGRLEGMAVQQSSSAPKEEPKPLTKPNVEDFQTYEAYEDANQTFILEKAKQELRDEFRRNQEAEKVKAQNSAFVERMQAAAKNDPTLLSIMSDQTLPVSPAMADVIKASDAAPELLKILNSDRRESARIAALPPVIAARELGLIEAKLKFAPKPEPPKRVSDAPTPIATVTPVTGPAIVNEDDLPIDEWMRRERDRLRSKGRRF